MEVRGRINVGNKREKRDRKCEGKDRWEMRGKRKGEGREGKEKKDKRV